MGHWIHWTNNLDEAKFSCSECKRKFSIPYEIKPGLALDPVWKYCPMCGSKNDYCEEQMDDALKAYPTDFTPEEIARLRCK